MAPSAVLLSAESGAPAVVADKAASKSQYASGNPSLSFMDEEVEQAPKFDDPHEERQYLKHRLALAFRVFAKFDLGESIAGHITVRDPVDPESFWVNPFGKFFVRPHHQYHGPVAGFLIRGRRIHVAEIPGNGMRRHRIICDTNTLYRHAFLSHS